MKLRPAHSGGSQSCALLLIYVYNHFEILFMIVIKLSGIFQQNTKKWKKPENNQK